MDAKWNDNSLTNARAVSERFDYVEEIERIERENIRLKAMQEKENHDNLNSIAQDSHETVQALREMNEVLKENNELLRKKAEDLETKLGDISDILRLLFDVDNRSCEMQEEELLQIHALENQILDALKRKEKINWKEAVTSTGIQAVFSVICSVLQTKGIL